MRSVTWVGLTMIFLLLFSGGLWAEEIRSFTVQHQGQVYLVPVKGWTFKRRCGSEYQPVTDMAVAISLARARDAFAQFLNPARLNHQALSEVLTETMNQARMKHCLNLFETTLSGFSGDFIGGAVKTALGDAVGGGASMAKALTKLVPGKKQVLEKVSKAIHTAAVAGSTMTTSSALGVGLLFGREAEVASAQAAEFQDAYFVRTGMGWWQKQPIHLPMLQKATGQAQKSLRLAYPAAVLMTEVTRTSGWEELKGFFNNTIIGTLPSGLNEIVSIIDDAKSISGDISNSAMALKAFDRAIKAGRGNPFTTDEAIYRAAVKRYCGIADDAPADDRADRQAASDSLSQDISSARPASGPAKTWTEPVTGMEFVWVPGGCFMMGSPAGEKGRYSDETQHKVCVDGFWMGRYEVTQGQWRRIMGSNPSHFKNGDNYPVENVSWNDARDFIKKLSGCGGKRVRLPTEAEWEYAARAGTSTPFAFGRTITPDQVNYNGNYPYGGAPKGLYRNKTTPVGSFAANAFGLHDMHGNVWEWCRDWYGRDYYRHSPRSNPQGSSSGSGRVLRGGGWQSGARHSRSANRNGSRPGNRIGYLGFRLVVPVGQ